MKYFTAACGALVAWTTYRYAPGLFGQLAGASGLSSAVLAAGALLTSGWGLALTKLSSLDKVDDLPAFGMEKVGTFSAQLRRRIIVAIIINTLLAVLSMLCIYMAGISFNTVTFAPVVGYVLCTSLGFWVGGLVESWSCYNAIEETRASLYEAQQRFKQRTLYLNQLRKDITEKPVNVNDLHLGGYTSDTAAT